MTTYNFFNIKYNLRLKVRENISQHILSQDLKTSKIFMTSNTLMPTKWLQKT